MTVAKERIPIVEMVDRIPHPKISFAFIELRVTGTVEEFLAKRSELLKKHPLYSESVLAKQPPGATPEAPADALAAAEEFQQEVQATEEDAAPTKAVVAAPKKAAPAKTASAATAPTAGQSARDIARARILAKKGA